MQDNSNSTVSNANAEANKLPPDVSKTTQTVSNDRDFAPRGRRYHYATRRDGRRFYGYYDEKGHYHDVD